MARSELTELLTTQDYFRLLSVRADFAATQGNYAISAALVLRTGRRETIFEGWNTLFGDHDPSGHAEMNAIRLAHAVASMPDDAAAVLVERARSVGALHARTLGRDADSLRVLYTTLEPCPMCTVCLINAGIDHVIVASEDPPSGTLERGRLERLPPLWLHLAEAGGLRVSFCQTVNADDSETYLPDELRDELLQRFAQSRSELDRSIGEEGVFDAELAGSHAWTLLHEE
jgi:tRNA(Arg) A34 adenosine deaminase TadA